MPFPLPSPWIPVTTTLVPTRGARHSLFIQNAGGILGGDNYFVKVMGETSWFFPMPLNTVLNLRGKVGFIEPYGGRRVPIYEKFFVGGLHTVRGFEYGMAGPVMRTKNPWGGKMVVFNSELIFPLAREIGLRGAVFWDVGKGFDSFSDITPLKTGVGVGIRWFSPFGPIHIDIGFNPSPKEGEKSERDRLYGRNRFLVGALNLTLLRSKRDESTLRRGEMMMYGKRLGMVIGILICRRMARIGFGCRF